MLLEIDENDEVSRRSEKECRSEETPHWYLSCIILGNKWYFVASYHPAIHCLIQPPSWDPTHLWMVWSLGQNGDGSEFREKHRFWWSCLIVSHFWAAYLITSPTFPFPWFKFSILSHGHPTSRNWRPKQGALIASEALQSLKTSARGEKVIRKKAQVLVNTRWNAVNGW